MTAAERQVSVGLGGENLTPGAAVRAVFPALAAFDEENVVYLDNAATTQKPACVLDAVEAFYRTGYAGPHRANHRLARASTVTLEDARATVARFIGADTDEVVFTSGATQALTMVAYGYGAATLRPGDEIMVSLLEHHSNLVPWQAVAKHTGAKLVPLVPDRAGEFSAEALDRALGPRTRVVALTATSNVLGSVPPIARITAAAHERGAVLVLDCAQSIAHHALDLHSLEVDFAAFSGHKLYGPLGSGVLYARRALLARTRPLLRGGGMVETVFEQAATFKEGPEGLEAGTQNVAGAVGLAEAVRFMENLGREAVCAHDDALTGRLVAGLAAIPTLTLLGAPADAHVARSGIVSFTVRGVSAAAAAQALDVRGIAVRAGTHCAQPLVRHLGVDACCRVSMGVYTTEHDVDRFLEAAESVQRDAVTLITNALL